ncbi:hypothetical protein ENBRE01_0592 [Enteropsectra breve]|nr:hypothetical protein ENBRE01_0592 [Enteropsectra breve]
MIECSLYGVAKQKFDDLKHEAFYREELKYEREGKIYWIYNERRVQELAVARTGHMSRSAFECDSSFENESSPVQDEEGSHTLLYYEDPDRNKQRISIARKVHKKAVEINGETERILGALKYKFLKKNDVEGFLYNMGFYNVELTRYLENSELKDYYLVKVVAENENVNIGEKILEKAINELEDYVDLVKPPIEAFMK